MSLSLLDVEIFENLVLVSPLVVKHLVLCLSNLRSRQLSRLFFELRLCDGRLVGSVARLIRGHDLDDLLPELWEVFRLQLEVMLA